MVHDKILTVGEGKRCCRLLLFALHLCYLVWFLRFLLVMVHEVWCLFGYLHCWGGGGGGGVGGFKVRFGEHELYKSKEGLYEEDSNVVQPVELSTWNLVVVYM
jgi:hypothetical protein